MNENKYYVLNPNIGNKYFPGNKVQIQSNDFFTVQKPSGTFRIFCLGGSTVTGYPYYYNASFPSFLRERLNKTFPEKNIEVVNLGMTAINSYMVLDMAKEITDYSPDLILVYDGHNEFYGPLGAASQKSFINSRWLNLTYLQLLHSRVFLLMRDGYNNLVGLFKGTGKDTATAITMELLAKGQYIGYNSEMYNKGLQIFKENMQDLISLCNVHKIPLILSTQVSNLRDQVPFISCESSGLSSKLKGEMNKHLIMGDKAGSEQHYETAMEELQKVLTFDSLHAAAHFGIAGCLDILGKKKEALIEYRKARDYDELRFRASTDFNRLILQMEDKKNIGVADAENIFMANSPDSLIGNRLILEHLHPNSYGQFLIAKAYALQIKKMGLISPEEGWNRINDMPDSILWNERSVSELDELIAGRRTEVITSTWPFAEGDSPITPINDKDTLKQIAEKVTESKWGWGDAHVAAIDYYKNKHDWRNLESEFKVMLCLLPNDVNSYLNLALFYIERQRLFDAKKILVESLFVKKTDLAEKLLQEIKFPVNNGLNEKKVQ